MTALSKTVVGQRIQHARLAAGYDNASEFAARCGMTYATLWRYETGKMLPGVQHVVSIAREANVSSDWLLGATENPARAGAAQADPFEFWLQHGMHGELTAEQVSHLRALPFSPDEAALLYYQTALQGLLMGLHGQELAKATEYTTNVKRRARNRARKRT